MAVPRPPLVIEDVFQLVLHWTLPAGQALNVLHFTLDLGAPCDQTLADDAATAVHTAFAVTATKNAFDAQTQLGDVDIRDLREPNQALITGTHALVAGTGTGSVIDPGNSAVVTFRTAKAGKRYRGRMYVPGMVATGDDTGYINANYVQVVTFVQALCDNVSAIGDVRDHVVASRGVWDADSGEWVHPPDAEAVTSVVGRSRIPGNIRRRAKRP